MKDFLLEAIEAAVEKDEKKRRRHRQWAKRT